MPVRRIEIEVVAAYDEVFGIRSFEDHDATRTKHAHHFVQQGHEGVERKVFDNVESGDRTRACIGNVVQEHEQILIADVETTCAALHGLKTVAIDTASVESVVRKQLQPLTTPAARIDHRRILFNVR